MMAHLAMIRISPRVPLPLLTLALGLCAGAWSTGAAKPEAFAPKGYTFELDVEVPVNPEVAWDHFTGDVSPWWDHHFTEKPEALTIAREPGGSFLEIFDAAGHGAEHARVTHAIRGELLRLVGPLGLVGHGVEIDANLHFEATDEGTRVRLKTFVHGKVDDATAAAVEGVWRHFLVEQYATYVRSR